MREDEPWTPGHALDMLEARIARHLERAGVPLGPPERSRLAQALLAEAVTVAVAWLESA